MDISLPGQLMTVKDAAAALCVSINTVYRMVKLGKLRKRIVGAGSKSYRILSEDVWNIIHPPQPRNYEPGSLRRKVAE